MALLLLLAAGCGGGGEQATGGGPQAGERRSGQPGAGQPGRRGGNGFAGAGFEFPDGGRTAGVPVEVAAVVRRPIAQYFETNGTLEAEHDIDLVARVVGPVVELAAEEGMRVAKGQLLARIDASEVRAQLAVAQVRLEETKADFERMQALFDNELVARDELDAARAAYESALGDVERTRIQLNYTEITAPFGGLIARRYVRRGQFVSTGTQLFRLSDFDPLLCPIQVPERELGRLRIGQPAEIEVEAWPGHRFGARVLRISPVVDADSGTIRVTLQVAGEGRLRPGMFASVFLEMESRPDALVIPKQALALDSLGDTVFVARDGVAERRAIEIGFENAELLEVERGLEEGELVVVVGQDGLSDGTPIEVLQGGRRPAPP
ncbi:MAG: efflux RND transporter periplasmic adaptor subunit, partial [Acidobacteria bacterium]